MSIIKRQLRVSGLKDYIAVDLVNEKGVILSTPFYLTAKGMQKIKYKDSGESFITNVFWTDIDHDYFSCRDSTGFDFHMPFDELLDPYIVTFI